MKFLKAILFSFIGIILIGIIAAAVFIATFNINQYKPRLAQTVSAALGRQVRIEGIQLSFKLNKGLTLAVKGFSIADDPIFSQKDLLTADLIYLNADLIAFITQRRIIISRVEIRGPHLQLIRNKDSALNVQSLTQPENKKNVAPGAPSGPTARHGKATALSLPPMLVQAISIVDGSLTWVDETSIPPLTVPLRQINLRMSNFSLHKTFPFQADAALWADRPNLHVRGNMSFQGNRNQVEFEKARLETDLSDWSLKATPFYGFIKEKLFLDRDLQGKLLLENVAMSVGPQGLMGFSLDGTLTDGKAHFEFFNDSVEDIRGQVHMDDSGIDLKELSCVTALGTMTAQGRWSDYGRSNMFMLDLHADGMQLAELIPRGKLPAVDPAAGPLVAEGRLYADLNIEGQGARMAEIQENLKGEGSLIVLDGKIRNLNVLKFVLDKISFMPDLVSQIKENLPESYKSRLETGETALERAALTASIRGSGVSLKADLNAVEFLMVFQGNLTFDQNLALSADLYVPADLSQGMAQSVGELAYFFDQQGRIHIPFKSYQGKWRDIRIYPDIAQLSQMVIRNKGQEELRKAIFRALNIEEAEEPPLPAEPQPDQKSRPEEIFLNNILDTIFKDRQDP